ncbi:MAG: glycosyltransferase family A protein [Candidatus Pacearchaeota archaeon]|nr:glycosyltransferase family A protein [Candidatus Pacearchaeota archaeon]
MPARNEFPNVIHTIYSIINSLEADGLDPVRDAEIIVVDNCSNDDTYHNRATKGTTSYIEGRGMFFSRAVKILRDPVAGNHSARNKGARIAKGKYLFFSDAHMAYKPGIFKKLMLAVDESGGIVHCPIGWMGVYPTHTNEGNPHGVGFQYTIKLGEEWKGTWNPTCLDTKKWFYIPALGHCSLMVNREQFLRFGGYPDIHRTYGGGEMFVNMLWWMMGSTVAVHPEAIGYHLASGRGYSYNHDDYKENVLGVTWALGADEWRERCYINWLRHGRKEVLDVLMERSQREQQPRREKVERERVKTFNELIVERPWDKLNEGRLGKSQSGLSIFQDTWLALLRKAPQYVQDVYDNSPLQKQLAEFIDNNLDQYVYKRKR